MWPSTRPARAVPSLQTPVSPNDFHQGDLSAPIQIVHFGDFECPYSRALTGTIQELQLQEGPRLLYVFRPFPLTDIHPNALNAARATFAANEQEQLSSTAKFKTQSKTRKQAAYTARQRFISTVTSATATKACGKSLACARRFIQSRSVRSVTWWKSRILRSYSKLWP